MKIKVPFKPKAQLLLQLGEQLIKSESIAVLELVKNSYDADATRVTISMNNLENESIGSIEILDNGIGMSIDTVRNVWMEPGNTHKKDIVKESRLSPLGRLPIGEKGIGRFGVHKLGKKIEMITKSKDQQEVCVNIDWRAFESADYLDEIEIAIEERVPVKFPDDQTGTYLHISDLSACWTRGMLRDVYRAITSLSSPFDSVGSFRVVFKTNHQDWLEGLISFNEIKKYALYSGHIELEKDAIMKFSYQFIPFANMAGLKSRELQQTSPSKMLVDEKNKRISSKVVVKSKKALSPQTGDTIDLSKYSIGRVKIDLMVFDRDSAFTSRFIVDKKTYGKYLDENGGIRVFRDDIRVFNYGEPDNDWLGLNLSRVNVPSRYISNNIVLGAIHLDRASSTDLREKANREGFIENAAFEEFKRAVRYVVNDIFTPQRNIDKEILRVYLGGGIKEPITDDISTIRQKIAKYALSEKEKKEIDGYLKNIESDFSFLKERYLKTANAGMSYGIVIHEIEKVISELNYAVDLEQPSRHIKQLARHLSRLVDSYAELLRNKSQTNYQLKDIIKQVQFSLQYRLMAHDIDVETILGSYGDTSVRCASNLIVGAMINIIDNSIWWTTHSEVPNKSICIKATDEINGNPAIVIADNGCGFKLSPEEMIMPFVTTKPNGLGLGLNIVNEIMLSQGGTLVFPDYGDVKLPRKFKNGAIVALVFEKNSL